MTKVVLAYWDIRGLAQHIRNVLEYVGQEYENKVYSFDVGEKDSENILEHWHSDKTSKPEIIGSEIEPAIEFPNLPYYIETEPDGTKFKLTQSTAILKHIARKHGLVVEGDKDISKMELYEQQACDLRHTFAFYCYNNPLATERYPNFIDDVKVLITPWDKLLAGKQWVMGEKLTYVDFILFEVLDWFTFMNKNFLHQFPSLKSFWERFQTLPRLSEYFESPRYKEWPLVSPFAKNFGWDREQCDK